MALDPELGSGFVTPGHKVVEVTPAELQAAGVDLAAAYAEEPGRDLTAPLDREYERLRREPSDINEHLPTLRALALEAGVVVELGMRTGVSTVALAAGRPARLVSLDVNPGAVRETCSRFRACGLDLIESMASLREPGVDFLLGAPWSTRAIELRTGSSLEWGPIPCDLLFVDTLHTERQLEAELERWAPVVRGKIALHDTVTFGKIGEDGRCPGLRGAINYFLHLGKGQGRWRIKTHYMNNNGLMVLERYAPEPGA